MNILGYKMHPEFWNGGWPSQIFLKKAAPYNGKNTASVPILHQLTTKPLRWSCECQWMHDFDSCQFIYLHMDGFNIIIDRLVSICAINVVHISQTLYVIFINQLCWRLEYFLLTGKRQKYILFWSLMKEIFQATIDLFLFYLPYGKLQKGACTLSC